MHKIDIFCAYVANVAFCKFLFHLGTVISKVEYIYLVSSEMKSLYY